MGSRYQAYPEYVASEANWLGDIPKSWKLSPLKYLARFSGGGTPSKDKPEYWSGNIPWVSPKDMKSSRIVSSIDKITEKAIEDSTTNLLNKGALLLVVRSGILQHSIPVAINDVAVTLNQDMKALRFNQRLDVRYGMYVVSGNQKTLLLKWGKQGATVESIEQEYLSNTVFPVPSISEQEKIADFLDHETAKIDTLIEKQQQLIKLLKEKRQAVISHAVTKGLNPNAPMRDSGIEWLGEVPEHWNVKRLKHISPKIGVGLVINPSTYTRDEGVYFIFGGDVKEYGFDLSKTRRISSEDSDSLLPSRLKYRDLVSIRVGYPGITAVVTEELEGSNCASVIVIRRGKYNSDWLCAAMNVWVGRQQVDLASYGAAQKQFNVADAIEFVFPMPPETEQNEIAAFVETSLNRFNTLSDKAEKQIALLQERRTALISAAVTGKIDVRNWVAPAHPYARNISASMHVTTPESSRNTTHTKETVA